MHSTKKWKKTAKNKKKYFVQSVQRDSDFGYIEARFFLRELPMLTEMREQFSTIHVVYSHALQSK